MKFKEYQEKALRTASSKNNMDRLINGVGAVTTQILFKHILEQ